jgi:hypothetical protein
MLKDILNCKYWQGHRIDKRAREMAKRKTKKILSQFKKKFPTQAKIHAG